MFAKYGAESGDSLAVAAGTASLARGGKSDGESGTDSSITQRNTLLPRILVIDDEQLLGQTIQLGLEDTMSVELETSGSKGLERLLTDDSIQLVLCDISLPDLSGIDIHAQVAKERPELMKRFIVMTGGAVSNESRDFLDRYEGPLLNKPFTLSQVEGLVAGLLEEQSAAPAL